MARVTVEDCLQNVKNRFELVMLASKRARQLMRGSAEPKVAWENDKATVVALREIAMGYTDFSDAHHAEPLATLQAAALPEHTEETFHVADEETIPPISPEISTSEPESESENPAEPE